MLNVNTPDDSAVSRRRLLQRSGAAIGLFGFGSHPSDDDTHEGGCPEVDSESGMVHYDDSIHEVCSDNHIATRALQADVEASLEKTYPTVGAIIDAGFIPYFDFFADGSWAHWINPDFVGDDSMLDPDRPESILVDNTWWRPIGVMFVATEGGEPVDPPPKVYADEDDAACAPWHAHTDVPGRYSWWKYQKIYENRVEFSCRTPWMLHVWRYPHTESVYAHSAPEERGGPPAEPPGFDTDADPDEEELGPEHLPDAIREKLDDRR